MSTPALLLFSRLMIAHYVADFPLQGPFIGEHKHPSRNPCWYHMMTAHAAIQAGGVWFVTGSPLFGLIEFLLHWSIDYGKCRGWFNFDMDQVAHALCKAVYTFLLV